MRVCEAKVTHLSRRAVLAKLDFADWCDCERLVRPATLSHCAAGMRRIGVLALVCCAGACPDDWTASKFGCHRVVRAPIGQYDCPERCGQNATLACIRSAEENAYIKDLTAGTAVTWLWLGHYKREQASGGWDSCATGENSTFSNGRDNPNDGEASSMAMYSSKSCVAMILSRGQWVDRPCPGPLSSIYDSLSCGGCLCEYGAESSPEFTAFVDTERRRFQDYMAPRNLFTGVWFGIALPLLSALPVLIPWCRSRGRARRSRRTAPVPYTVQESSPNSQSEETESSTRSTNTLLAEAELASVQLRHRVSGTIALVGWVLCLVGWSPFVLVFLGNSLAAAGPFPCWLGAAFLGTPTLLLALRATDAARVAIACRFFFGLNVLLACVACVATLNSRHSRDGLISSSIFVALCVATAAFLAPAAFSCRIGRCCVAASSMPPRRQLRRLWVAARCWLIFTAIIHLSVGHPSCRAVPTGRPILPRLHDRRRVRPVCKRELDASQPWPRAPLAWEPRQRRLHAAAGRRGRGAPRWVRTHRSFGATPGGAELSGAARLVAKRGRPGGQYFEPSALRNDEACQDGRRERIRVAQLERPGRSQI